MGKFKVPSWLQPPASDADSKKQNRRSFSGFSQRKPKHDAVAVIPKAAAAAAAPVDEGKPAADHQSRLVELARKISAEAEKLETYLRNNSLPEPGFGVDAPDDFPKLPGDVQRSRQEIIYATKELESLVRGPRETVRWGVWNASRLRCSGVVACIY
jgi:hypothetical protein